MSDDWDVYLARLDDELAAFALDFGVAEKAPIRGFGDLAQVTLTMQDPRGDGLASPEEAEVLQGVEDALVGAVIAGGKTTYVGRCTTGGRREFYFYSAAPEALEARVAEALAGTDYISDFDFERRADADWNHYFDFLYPSEREVQLIENRRICEALSADGDKLSEARRIDHFIRFNRETSARGFLEIVAAQGFTVDGEGEDVGLFGPDERGKYHARIWREDCPAPGAVDALILPLFDLAQEHHGRYEGWEPTVLGDTATGDAS
jgi:uncharacterized protein (TIGR01619 family)